MRGSVWLFVVCGLTLFAGIGRFAITDSDEAFYAESGREMIERGDYLTPYFNYAPRFQKPILFYWTVTTAYQLAGENEFAARAGSALAGLGMALVIYGLGRRWYGQPTARLAGLIVATCFGTAAMARASLPDLPLAFFITASIAAGLVPLIDREPRPRRWWVVSAACAGLAFLTKGPVGLVLPLLVLGICLVGLRRCHRPSAGTIAVSALVFIGVAAPWYVAMAVEHGPSYLHGFFVGDNIERFATARFNDPRPFWYFAPIVLGGLLPWSPFLVLLAGPAWRVLRRRERTSPHGLALSAWTLLPLLFYSASIGKQARYILPILAPLALAMARQIELVISAPADGWHQPTRTLRVLAGLSAAILGTFAILLTRSQPLLAAAGITGGPVAAVVAGAGALAVGCVAASRRWRWLPATLTLAAAITVVAVQVGVLSMPGPEPVRQVADLIAAERRAGEQVGSYKLFVRNLVYYTRVPQADLYSLQRLLDFLDSPDPALCVLPERDLAEVEATGRHVRRLGSVRLFDPATAKPRSLVWPDPDRDLQTVYVVRNR